MNIPQYVYTKTGRGCGRFSFSTNDYAAGVSSSEGVSGIGVSDGMSGDAGVSGVIGSGFIPGSLTGVVSSLNILCIVYEAVKNPVLSNRMSFHYTHK